MIKIFLNEKPVIFIEKPGDFTEHPGHILLESLEKDDLQQAIIQFEQNQEQLALFVVGKDTEKSFRKFCALFITVEAGGGLIINKEGHYLFMFRRGKWDLPKGKSEKGEPISDTAKREVKEETGLDVEMNSTIGVTYHAYREGELIVLKKTYWFGMIYHGDQKPVPQTSEDISRIKWLDQSDIERTIYKNTYASIKDLLINYFEHNHHNIHH
jgi:8-oxo-dGTP pyrophosphatase MutT (NUDIX family)